MIRIVCYGQSGNKAGYNFLRKDGISDEILRKIEPWFNFNGKENGEQKICYHPLKDGKAFFGCTTRLAHGSINEERSQIFGQGYIFDKKDIYRLMKNPPDILKIRYYSSFEEMAEMPASTLSLEELLRNGVKENNPAAEYVNDFCDEEILKLYLYCIVNNENTAIGHQIYQLSDNLSKENSLWMLVKLLEYLPEAIRSTVSWSLNSRSIQECNDFEINFVSEMSYADFEARGFDGGKAVNRIVIRDEMYDAVSLSGVEKMWKGYCKAKQNELFACKSRAELKDFLLQYMNKKEFDRKRKNSRKRKFNRFKQEKETRVRKTKNKKILFEKVFLFIKALLLLLGIVYLGSQITIQPHIFRTGFSVFVSGTGVTFIVQMLVAFLVVDAKNVICKLVKTQREEHTYDECINADDIDADVSDYED